MSTAQTVARGWPQRSWGSIGTLPATLCSVQNPLRATARPGLNGALSFPSLWPQGPFPVCATHVLATLWEPQRVPLS